MLFNYILEYKLISFKNAKIVSPATFVNESNIELNSLIKKVATDMTSVV